MICRIWLSAAPDTVNFGGNHGVGEGLSFVMVRSHQSAWRRRGWAVLALALAASPAEIAARSKAPAPPTGELLLDMDDPVVTVKVGEAELRLRVGLGEKKLIELNPSAAARMPIKFEPGFVAQVGRETLPGIAAAAEARIDGRKFLILLSSHGRDCCAGVDGAIGVTALPYATVRFVRRGAERGREALRLAMVDSDARGLETQDAAPVRLQFSLDQRETVATAAAGAILAKAHGGRRETGEEKVTAAFGIERPAQVIRFGKPFELAGFAFDRLTVRVADFAGRNELPRDAAEAGDIVVNRRVARQEAWPVVQIGRDRLDRCFEILFETQTAFLTLRCDFKGAPR